MLRIFLMAVPKYYRIGFLSNTSGDFSHTKIDTSVNSDQSSVHFHLCVGHSWKDYILLIVSLSTRYTVVIYYYNN